MLIHLPPSTDDIEVGGRDERDVINEQLSEAQVMYSIISSTLKKGLKAKLYGQKHISFEIVAHDGFIKYYAVVPAVLTETIKQAITAAYPTARMEEVADPNFFSAEGKIDVLIFFCDNLIMQGHQNDVSALTRLASLYNIAFATNRTTADMILTSPLFKDPNYNRILPNAIENYKNRTI